MLAAMVSARRRLRSVLTGLDVKAAGDATASPETVTLDNGAISVTVALQGGFITSVCPSGRPDGNPLTNRHFICCDRWGPASKAEQQGGMTWHYPDIRDTF